MTINSILELEDFQNKQGIHLTLEREINCSLTKFGETSFMYRVY